MKASEPMKLPGLWKKFLAAGLTPHAYFARKIDWSFSIYAEIANRALARHGIDPLAIGLSADLVKHLRSGEPPVSWRPLETSFMQRAQYLEALIRLEDA